MGVTRPAGSECRSTVVVAIGYFNAEFAEDTERRGRELRFEGGLRLRRQKSSFKTCRAERCHYDRVVFIVKI
jgi:hypothetical protein